MDPIAAIENAPLDTPNMNTVLKNGQPGPINPDITKLNLASAEAIQPNTDHIRKEDQLGFLLLLVTNPHKSIPQSTPAC